MAERIRGMTSTERSLQARRAKRQATTISRYDPEGEQPPQAPESIWARAGWQAARELAARGMTPPPSCYALLAAAARRHRERQAKDQDQQDHPPAPSPEGLP